MWQLNKLNYCKSKPLKIANGKKKPLNTNKCKKLQ